MTFLVRIDSAEERCQTPEEVGRLVARYQMEHPDDPRLERITIVSELEERQVPADEFLPQQIP